MNTDRYINDFARRCFRDTADRDYIHARLAYHARLVPQFLWSSLHCLEKYVKGILLMNRIEEKNLRHKVFPGIKKLRKLTTLPMETTAVTDEFIKRLDQTAQYRYFEVSWSHYKCDLARLDRAVWEIRRYCQILEYKFDENEKKVEMLEENIKRVKSLTSRTIANTRISGGWLEKVLDDKNHSARSALVKQNLYYSNSTRKSVKMENYFIAENAPLYLKPELIQEIKKYIFLPKDVINAYEEACSR